jgi:CheY-like chemotaxis protein
MPHRLLLADDSVTIQRVIELTFADEDVEVTAVGDGQEAIDLILRDRPDIVLADIDMPKRDGYEVASFIKHDPALANIPVLLLAGAFEPVDESRARAVGCDGVLTKPFEPQSLIDRVQELLARATAPSPGLVEEVAPAGDDAVLDLESMAFRAELTAEPETSLDDYFDRLDAAFAHLAGGQSAHDSASAARPAGGRVTEVSGAFPHDSGGASSAPPATAGHADAPATGGEPGPAGPGTGLPVSDAFAALLDAEQMFGPDAVHGEEPPPAVTVAPSVAIDDAHIDDIARRVIERIGETAVREAVSRVVSATAERLVREEIERLRAGVK